MTERNAVNPFHYSSTLAASKGVIFTISSANSYTINSFKKIFVTDLKITGGAASGAVNFGVFSTTAFDAGAQNLKFDVASATPVNFNWEIPYRFIIQGTTDEVRYFAASSDKTDMKYSISGYVE